MEEHNLHDVVFASWIKSRTTYTKVVLITFMDGNIPEYIEISGEQFKIKVMNIYLETTYILQVLRVPQQSKIL